MERCIIIGGCKINNLWYADDIVLLTNSEKELQDIMKKQKVFSEKLQYSIEQTENERDE